MQIAIIAHYYPPINSSGAKRAEALSKYFIAAGHGVTVITPTKSDADGSFTEQVPPGVNLVELDWLGRERTSKSVGAQFEPMYTGRPSVKRRMKDLVMRLGGQIPDPRLPFAFSLLSPWLSARARRSLSTADIVIGTTPPWPMVLGALFCKWRFKKPCILDYRDHFSECHEIPGGRFAKWLEKIIDRRLATSANHLVCISEPMSQHYRSWTPKVATILNGYDSELLEAARTQRDLSATDRMVRIRYMGLVSPGRVPHNVFRALVQLQREDAGQYERIRVEFFGNAALIGEALQNQYPTIAGAFAYFSPVPYIESLRKITEADYLLFSETSSQKTLSAQGILTTKLFEYIGSGRPVIADISPATLAGSLLIKCGNQHIVGDSFDVFLVALRKPDFYERQADIVSEVSASVSRKAQAHQYLALISQVLSRS